MPTESSEALKVEPTYLKELAKPQPIKLNFDTQSVLKIGTRDFDALLANMKIKNEDQPDSSSVGNNTTEQSDKDKMKQVKLPVKLPEKDDRYNSYTKDAEVMTFDFNGETIAVLTPITDLQQEQWETIFKKYENASPLDKEKVIEWVAKDNLTKLEAKRKLDEQMGISQSPSQEKTEKVTIEQGSKNNEKVEELRRDPISYDYLYKLNQLVKFASIGTSLSQEDYQQAGFNQDEFSVVSQLLGQQNRLQNYKENTHPDSRPQEEWNAILTTLSREDVAPLVSKMIDLYNNKKVKIHSAEEIKRETGLTPEDTKILSVIWNKVKNPSPITTQ